MVKHRHAMFGFLYPESRCSLTRKNYPWVTVLI